MQSSFKVSNSSKSNQEASISYKFKEILCNTTLMARTVNVIPDNGFLNTEEILTKVQNQKNALSTIAPIVEAGQDAEPNAIVEAVKGRVDELTKETSNQKAALSEIAPLVEEDKDAEPNAIAKAV